MTDADDSSTARPGRDSADGVLVPHAAADEGEPTNELDAEALDAAVDAALSAGIVPASDQSDAIVDAGDGLQLDELDERLGQFVSLRKSDSAAAEALLTEFGASDEVDRRIILELSANRPLGHPQRFLDAHGLAVRSLEVLDRNATAGIPVPNASFLTPVLRWLVQLVTNFLVRRHVAGVIDALGRLYVSREAACPAGDSARPLLIRARRDIERLTPKFKRNPLGIPAFLLGGAVLSPVVSLIQNLINSTADSVVARIVALAITLGVFCLLAWLILRGAAVARVRIRLTTEGPMRALYETIGRCGEPPKDQARIFAFLAIVVLAIAWLIVPLLAVTLL